jgi:hypothetical protein
LINNQFATLLDFLQIGHSLNQSHHLNFPILNPKPSKVVGLFSTLICAQDVEVVQFKLTWVSIRSTEPFTSLAPRLGVITSI